MTSNNNRDESGHSSPLTGLGKTKKWKIPKLKKKNTMEFETTGHRNLSKCYAFLFVVLLTCD